MGRFRSYGLTPKEFGNLRDPKLLMLSDAATYVIIPNLRQAKLWLDAGEAREGSITLVLYAW